MLVKVTSVRDASNFLRVLNEYTEYSFENIFELVDACNDELRMLLMEIIITSDRKGEEYIGIRSNIEDSSDIKSSSPEKYALLSLGIKKMNEFSEAKVIRIIKLYCFKSVDGPVSFDEICLNKDLREMNKEDERKMAYIYRR
ncbi:hypothetical protein FG379_001970 [Cryptosporidium bovis]|uniref:uncharacterized protein n=1 Tax=Cryptosporidium bovis TaxID=310047 RepID=UPI00351A45BF|nr:hypothetical protein FG379_001970 [Cryptosporidium bovis]